MNVTETDEAADVNKELWKKFAVQMEVMYRSKLLTKAGASSFVFSVFHSKVKAGCLPKDREFHKVA